MIEEGLAFHQAAHTGRLAYLDLGTGNATIEIYGNTRPSAGAAAGAAPLLTFTLTKPAGAVVGLNLELEAAGLALVMNSGGPTWARFKNGNGDFAFDAGAGGPLSGAEVVCSVDTLLAGGEVALASAAIG